MILTECAQCGTQFKLPDSVSGKKVRCARCHTKFRAEPIGHVDGGTPAATPSPADAQPPVIQNTPTPFFEAKDLDDDVEIYSIKDGHSAAPRAPRAGVTDAPAPPPAKRPRVCPECGAEMLITETVCDVCKFDTKNPRKKRSERPAQAAVSERRTPAGALAAEGSDPALIGLAVGLAVFAAASFYLLYLGWFA